MKGVSAGRGNVTLVPGPGEDTDGEVFPGIIPSPPEHSGSLFG